MLPHFCIFCKSQIVEDQRWCREKLHGSGQGGTAPAYRYWHADVFGGETLSCHEKWLKEAYDHVT